MRPNGYPHITPACEDGSRRAPNLYPEFGAADMLTALRLLYNIASTATVTNKLDDQQQRIADKKRALSADQGVCLC